MTFVMNERKYAESILNGEGVGDARNRSYTVGVIAKYYSAIGYNSREVKVAVEKLIRERVSGISNKYIENWVKKAVEISKKYPLYELDEIAITKPEMELIKTLHSKKFLDRNLRKLAFTLLCFAKFESMRGIKDNWINIEWSHIFSAANIRGVTIDKQCLMIHELYTLGYIDLNTKIESHNIKVLGVEDGEREISVKNINECGYIFEEYNGKKFVRCERCGAMVPVTNGRNKYCRDCAKNIDREKARERMKKRQIFKKFDLS